MLIEDIISESEGIRVTVKKIISDYRDHEFRNLPHLHRELNELNSYTEDYYISQRDEYNQKQRDEYYKPIKEEQTRREGRIGEMNENLR